MSNLKKHWLGYTISLLLLVAGIFAWGIYQKTRFDQSSRDAVSETIAAVLYEESYSTLVDRAYNAQVNERPVTELTNYLVAIKRTLGELNEVSGLYGEAQVPLINLSAAPIVASYEADLEFASGPAAVQIAMHYVDGQWRTSRFLISSQRLLN
jgi:hypothetical protein